MLLLNKKTKGINFLSFFTLHAAAASHHHIQIHAYANFQEAFLSPHFFFFGKLWCGRDFCTLLETITCGFIIDLGLLLFPLNPSESVLKKISYLFFIYFFLNAP